MNEPMDWREEDEEEKKNAAQASNSSSRSKWSLNGEWKKATREVQRAFPMMGERYKRESKETVVLLEQQVKRDSFAPSLNTPW